MREFELIGDIRGLSAATPLPPHVRVGIGDDCCVFRPLCADELVLSVDAAVEGVHFRLDWTDYYHAGARATAAALSDLAAMAAEPLGVLATVSIPASTNDEAVREIARGLIETAGRFGCPLVGGDLTASPGPLMISLTVTGKVPQGEAILRSGAAPGQDIWITGEPGESAAVLEYLRRVERGEAGGLPVPDERARGRFHAPLPRIREALMLRGDGPPSAMIDISDGLAADLGHILEASKIGAVLDEAQLPVGEYSPRLARALGLPDRHFLLRGGEDYELCLCAHPGLFERTAPEIERITGTRLTRIGRTTGRTGKLELAHRDGSRSELDLKGYEHFT